MRRPLKPWQPPACPELWSKSSLLSLTLKLFTFRYLVTFPSCNFFKDLPRSPKIRPPKPKWRDQERERGKRYKIASSNIFSKILSQQAPSAFREPRGFHRFPSSKTTFKYAIRCAVLSNPGSHLLARNFDRNLHFSLLHWSCLLSGTWSLFPPVTFSKIFLDLQK